jgi:hypothetical protein
MMMCKQCHSPTRVSSTKAIFTTNGWVIKRVRPCIRKGCDGIRVTIETDIPADFKEVKRDGTPGRAPSAQALEPQEESESGPAFEEEE